ncbi:MAG: FlgD immunoglobulin-like domain containing protein [Fidelibacterota bacterium]
MKRNMLIFLIALVSVAILPAKEIVKGQGVNRNHDIRKVNNMFRLMPSGAQSMSRGTADTMAYQPPGGWGGQFIQSPGDAMITAFQMTADATIKAVNIPVYEWGTGDQQLTVSLHKLSYPYDADGNLYSSDAVDGDGWIGGYDMDASTGYMSIEGTTYTPGGTAGVCDTGDEVVAGAHDPLGLTAAAAGPPGTPLMGLLWPDGFSAATLDPTNNPDFAVGGSTSNWINLADFGSEVDLLQGDWVGIMVAFTGTGDGSADEPTGFFYASGDGVVDPWVSIKFYNECGGTSGNGGWHIRHWMFDFELAVDLTGDRGPVFTSVDALPTTLSTAARSVSCTITDDNPSGGTAGVASVTLDYQLDSLTAPVNTVTMTMTDGTAEDGTWEAEIPGQSPGTFVYWSITATDGSDLSTTSSPFSYFIFEATAGNDLIFNNQDALYGSILYSSYLYFYWGGEPFDIWDASYGGIVDELTVNYSTIVELAGTGPYFNNDDEIAAWWDGDKTYIVSSDEWLGARTGWVNTTYGPGDFPYDILGIAADYNDINYAASGDQSGISRLMMESDGFASAGAGFLADSLYLNYDPDYETGGSNWLDGVDPATGYTVDMTGYSLVLDSADQVDPPTGSEVYNVMIHGQAGNGGKSAFLAFDAMALNTIPSYHWIGASYFKVHISGSPDANMPENASPLIQAYEDLNAIVSVENDVRPDAFSLKGNYPNPFNPTTNISFNLDVRSDVTVTVYSLLGEEVATIHNGAMQAGLQSVKWNGTDSQGIQVASGVYIYRVEAQNRALTGKMMFLK